MDRVSCVGLPNCFRMTNDEIELIVTTDVGPRILHYGFVGGPNILGHFPDLAEGTEWGEWKPLGGHRLWVGPEAKPFSYAPDNTSIEARVEGNYAIRLIQPVDASGFQKEISVSIYPSGSRVDLHHRITYRGAGEVLAAPWALTIMSGGRAILPLEPHRDHGDVFLPSQPLILWPFTDLSDPRLSLNKSSITLASDENANTPQKIGLANKQGWAAYHKQETLFVKAFAYQEGETYPDYGSNCELFTKGTFLEVESLGPQRRLTCGESIDHTERWHLYPNVGLNELNSRIADLAQVGPTPGF